AMLFCLPRTRSEALAALARLDEIRAHPRLAALRRDLGRHLPAVDPAAHRPDRVWREYAADAASFTTLLSTIIGAGRPDHRDFVPPSLRRTVSELRLDTSLLTSRLRGYQVFGAQYAIHQRRAILGDEMGLGKTIQAIAVLAHLAAGGERRFLVVCPASVQVNWLNEIARHSRLTGHPLHGPGREQAARDWLRDGGVAVTTFGTLPRLSRVLSADVAALVVDEAHYVKNPSAARSQVVRRVAANARHALFLTGTPMENRVTEFRHLVEHLHPTVAARIGAGEVNVGAAAFRRAVAPVYLRRNQEDVLAELPDRIEVEDWVQPTGRDHRAYVAAVAGGNLMAMRQAAFRAKDSAKLERLVEIVQEAGDDGRKVVVFSFFLGVLETVAAALGRRVTGTITGSVPAPRRQELVDAFTRADGHAVLLAQIEAGGVGLNVQAASVVVITEPQWKPSTEAQAIARAHRMGQVRRVQVHRLLAKGTVDERLREVQEQKALLFERFARRSDAKDAHPGAIAAALDDTRIPLEQRVIAAERHRLGVRPD
ncbi:MAG TPA: DEAD/DEAH box helicase, partial [Pseudonocardiaceae bacterium]